MRPASSSTGRRAAAFDASSSATKLVQDALAVVPQTGPVVVGTAVGTALSAHAEILVALAARIDELSARAAAENAVLRETLLQQTWLLESWCETADLPWSEVPAEARALIAALELAARTNGSAPAIGAESLLASVLSAAGGARSLEPSAAVAAAAPFLDGKLTAAPSAMLFPVATALARWREGQPLSGWEAPAPAPDATVDSEPAIGWETPAGAETPPGAETPAAAEPPLAADIASGWDTPAPEAVGGWDAPAGAQATGGTETAAVGTPRPRPRSTRRRRPRTGRPCSASRPTAKRSP